MPGITTTTNLHITYTPRGTGAVQVTIFLQAGHGRQPSRFDDGPMWNKSTSVTEGGKAVTVIHDLFYADIVRIESIPISHDLPGSPLWAQLQNWWMHAGSGGLFGLELSRERATPFTLTTGASQGDTNIDPGANPTAIPRLVKENDTLRFVDDVDPTQTEFVIADADATTGPNNITWLPQLQRDYANNSKIEFADAYTNCLAIQENFPLKRRAAKAGPFVWDFQLRFRTTRV